MKNLNEFNFENKVKEMIDDFYGVNDSDAICNIHIDGRIVQVSISLIDEDEIEFCDYEGIPLIDL